ncbi:hypothetical protein BKI52_08460 [marine bacterium AO1-C]|nr:hypothetical protein BKI52_08460 [marine bacterium AO1-C]
MLRFKINWILLLVLLSLFCSRGQAQQTIWTSQLKEKLPFNSKTLFSLIDTTNRISIDQIIQQSIPFEDSVKINVQFNSPYAHWFKLQYNNDKPTPVTRFIHLGYASLVDVYVVKNQEVIEHNTEGVSRPMNQRKLITGNYTQVSFKCPANTTVSVYLKVKSVLNYTLWLHPEIMTSEYWKEHKQNLDIREGVFLGFLTMMMFYSLFLFVSLKDITYLYYAIYIFFQAVYSLYVEQYIGYYIPYLGENLNVSKYFALTLNFSFLFYFVLMRYFNDLKGSQSRIDKWLVIWIRIHVIVVIISSALLGIDRGLFNSINDTFQLILTVVTLVFLFVLFRYNGILGRYFVLGSFFLLAGGIISVVGNINGIPPYENAIYYHAGVVLEIFIFSLGLSIRFRNDQEEKQRVQQELIGQLKQNEALQENYAKELKQTVDDRTSELQHANKELKQAYTKITDSVQYAQRIQRSILAAPEEIAHFFKGLFIFFEPKDIVSGDFYWFTEICTAEGSQLILAAVDCTGHGVPGAFMTIMGNDFLTEIVETRGITQPKRILEELDKKILLTLQKQTRLASTSDGMDIAIVSIHQEHKTIQFAGAKNPLWYVRDQQMNRIKASPHSIGYSQLTKNKAFQNHTIQLQSGDVFYIFSDGFQDQFGGPNNRKYMRKRFREFLLQMSSHPIAEQKKLLHDEFYQWKATQEQTDDVMVIGFQFD